jgi:guanylate kinase
MLYVISSVAGGGKSTIIAKVLEKYKDIHFSISYTSRPVRKDDVPGANYQFVTKKEFEDLIKEDFFLEWALVHDNYYGTPKKFIDFEIQKGNKVILDIDVQGFRIIRSKIEKLRSIFILPPSEEIWIDRLKKRGTDSEEVIEKRIRNGRNELKAIDEYDFKILNDVLETAVLNFENILFNEEDIIQKVLNDP